VTGRRGSPLPRRAAASAASDTSLAEAPKPGRKYVPRVAPVEAPLAAPPATRSRHETAPATTVASLAIGPRSLDTSIARDTLLEIRRRDYSLTRRRMELEVGIEMDSQEHARF
jgi:hypothetical protein